MAEQIKRFDKDGLQAYINLEKYGLSSFALKVIAVLTMLIDHIAAVLLKEGILYEIFRGIGRISFPIFAFLIVEGFFHTSNRKKYAKRLAIFALLSEIPYDLAFLGKLIDFERQNVFFTLLLGMLAVWALHSVSMGMVTYPEKLLELVGIGRLQWFLKALIMCAACGGAYWIGCSYSYAGVFLILCFYVFYDRHFGKACANAFFHIGMYGGMQSFGTFSVIPIALYNGQPGKRKWKWFFYLFYPIHLVLLAIIKNIIG